MTTPFPFVSGAVLTAAQMNDITNLPINDQTASYSLVVGDAGKRVVMNVATANTVTVDDSIFAAGDTIFVANKGAGASTVTAGAGVTINSASGLVLVQHQSGQLVALSASSFLFVASDVTATSGVVQVKSTTKSDTFTSASTTFVDITGVSVGITPTSASNKVLVTVMLSACNAVNVSEAQFRLMRDSTAVGIGDAAGLRTQASLHLSLANSSTTVAQVITFLDSPATTAATTYKMQGRTASAGSFFVNRSQTDGNSPSDARVISSITVMEVTP